MTIHYMDGGPFETKTLAGASAVIVGYEPASDGFVAVLMNVHGTGGLCGVLWSANMFDPPPPIPAAARKPQVGEVWMHKNGEALFLFSPSVAGAWYVMRPNATHSWCEMPGYRITRPATPEEAEPFRPVLEGLKRSLGEA